MGVDAEMLVRVPRVLDWRQVRRESVAMCVALGPEWFMITEPGDDTRGRHALEIVDRYTQDGPDILPEPGETLVQVHLCTRYYGVDYERGNLVFLLAVARWLRHALAPCVVWYGGDSSGMLAEPLDAAREAALWAHFRGPRGRAYFDYSLRGRVSAPVRCKFCERDAARYGGGGGDDVFVCNGCGGHWRRNTATGKVARQAPRMFADKGEGDVPRDRRPDALAQLLAALSIGECAVEEMSTMDTRDDGHATRVRVSAVTHWASMTPDQRAEALERASVLLAELAGTELRGGRP